MVSGSSWVESFGFRQNRETREAIFSLIIIPEKQIERQKSNHMALKDVKKDIHIRNIFRIHREQKVLNNINFTTKLIAIKMTLRKGVHSNLYYLYIEHAVNCIKL